MAGKTTKATKTMLVDKKSSSGQKTCPNCGEPMIATKVMRTSEVPSGMYWICAKDDTRLRIL